MPRPNQRRRGAAGEGEHGDGEGPQFLASQQQPEGDGGSALLTENQQSIMAITTSAHGAQVGVAVYDAITNAVRARLQSVRALPAAPHMLHASLALHPRAGGGGVLAVQALQWRATGAAAGSARTGLQQQQQLCAHTRIRSCGTRGGPRARSSPSTGHPAAPKPPQITVFQSHDDDKGPLGYQVGVRMARRAALRAACCHPRAVCHT